jgi:alginate O-acetyltransferase complex protein AlgI
MSLGDPQYLLFLGAAVIVFYLLRPGNMRIAWLLGASYLFYFELSRFYISILMLVTAIAFVGGLLLSHYRKAAHRGLLFSMFCIALLTPLIVFKYLAFLLGVAASLVAQPFSPSLLAVLAMPIGISFFTFAALGYLIDVYLDVIEPELSPLKFALFVAFFPLVTAGPIERGAGLLPQFDLATPFSSERALHGLRLIFIGLFLKVVCADRLLSGTSPMFDDPSAFIPVEKVLTMVQYAFYIYADFAGYSLIAIGSAALFGWRVRPNFQQPYLSTSIPEFWRNWHISLSSWVRDYLFMPLRMRMRRFREAGMVAALMISFLIIGLWHGAGWGFVLFGLMHGALAVASNYTLRTRDAAWSRAGVPAPAVQFWRTYFTFVLVMFTFVVFRANTLHDASVIYRDLLPDRVLHNAWQIAENQLLRPHRPSGFKVITLRSSTWWIVAVIIIGDIAARKQMTLDKLPRALQFAAYNIGVLLIIYGWISAGGGQPFLYYRF